MDSDLGCFVLVFAPVMWIALMDLVITGDSILRSAEMISQFGY